MPHSLVVSKEFIYRLTVVIRDEPLTEKFSCTVLDSAKSEKVGVQTQFNTFEDAAKAAGSLVRQLVTSFAVEAESSLVKELLTLRA